MIDIYKIVLCTAIQHIESMDTHPISCNYGHRTHYTMAHTVLARQYNKILHPFEVEIDDI